MQAKSKRTQRGFTLVELMVAVTIIGILAAVGIPRLFAYVRTSSTAEVTQNAGKIIAGLESYAQSQLKAPADIVDEVDGTTVTAAGDGTLTAFIPTIEVPQGSNFDYTIDADIGAAETPMAGEVVYCITATGLDSATVEGGVVMYSSAETDALGWDRHLNRVDYVNGNTAFSAAEAGGYCGADGAVSADYVDAGE